MTDKSKIYQLFDSVDSDKKIGILLLQSQFGITQIEAEAELVEYKQEEVCEMCEFHILGCKSSTSTFLCEGSRCEDAYEMYIEEINLK